MSWLQELIDLEIICTISMCLSFCLVTYWIIKKVINFVKWRRQKRAQKKLAAQQKRADELLLAATAILKEKGVLK